MVYLNNSLKESLFTGLCDFNPNENIYVLLLHVPPQYPPSNPPTLSISSVIFVMTLLWSLESSTTVPAPTSTKTQIYNTFFLCDRDFTFKSLRCCPAAFQWEVLWWLRLTITYNLAQERQQGYWSLRIMSASRAPSTLATSWGILEDCRRSSTKMTKTAFW